MSNHTGKTANENNSAHPAGELSAPKPTRGELLTYAFGNSAVVMGNGLINALQFPIFNMLLGVNPGMIGLIAAVGRIWDAITDPVMGQISDNARTRFGRRMPFIFAGGVSSMVCIALFYFCSSDWSSTAILIWFGAFFLLFNTATTVIGVPYYALGIEMGTDYDQRTRVVAYRSFTDKAVGILGQWYFRFTELFSHALLGARWIAGAIAVVGITTTVVLVTRNKEYQYQRAASSKALPQGFWQTIGSVLANPVYLRLLAIWVILTLNTGVFAALGMYLNVYYVYGGDKSAGATLGGVVGTLGLVLSLLAIPLTKSICDKLGKHRALVLALWLYVAGSVLKWWCVSPEYPWLQLVLPFFFSIGISSIYIVMSSMQADVVDMDELLSGKRREGMFGAIGGWVMKMGGSLAVALSGWVIVWTGFDVKHGAEQPEGVFFAMRVLFSLIPAAGSLLALLAIRNWPLTRERCEDIRRELSQRRAIAGG